MKNLSFFVSLAVVISAFANPNPLEKRQDLPCLDVLCALEEPITLSGDLGFALSTSLLGIGVTLTAVEPFTTTVGGACCEGATCATATGTLPTTLPVEVELPATITVPLPLLATTLTVTLPTAGFSGEVTLPAVSTPSAGVCLPAL